MDHITIGKFSRLSRLSVKALRHYDEVGLLKPADVDADTGYRYYTVAQAADAERIQLLRAVGMPLPDIAALLASTPEAELKLLEGHRARLAATLATSQEQLRSLGSLVDRLKRSVGALVELKEAPRAKIISRRASLTAEQVDPFIPATIIPLVQALYAGGGRLGGPALTLYHESPLEEAVDLEVGVVVDESAPVPAGIPCRELAAEQVASTMHRGPYEELSHAHRELLQWVTAKGLAPSGAWRELYLVSPPQVTNPADYVTEVQLPVSSSPG